MRILLVTQYFAPERTAAPLRLDPLARGLAARGHQVDVVCEIPAHPEGVVHPGYGGRPLVRRRPAENLRVDHVRAWPTTRRGAAHRLASYAAYAALGTATGSLRRRPDVIWASSPPLSVGAVARLLAARFQIPWVFDVRDLWPSVALALGEIQPGRVSRAAERLERSLYHSAAALTVPTEPFRDAIHAINPAAQVEILPNGTTDRWLEAASRPVAREQLGCPDGSFVWMYAGNVGLSQDLGVALDAAEQLGDGFTLMILGDGASKAALQERAAGMPAGRVAFHDPVDPALAAPMMAAADALLVPLADDPILAKTVPVKLYDSCAVGRPVVVAAPGESRRLAERHNAALTVAPGDAAGLAAAIRRLRDEPSVAEQLSSGARELAQASRREAQVPVLEALLETAAD